MNDEKAPPGVAEVVQLYSAYHHDSFEAGRCAERSRLAGLSSEEDKALIEAYEEASARYEECGCETLGCEHGDAVLTARDALLAALAARRDEGVNEGRAETVRILAAATCGFCKSGKPLVWEEAGKNLRGGTRFVAGYSHEGGAMCAASHMHVLLRRSPSGGKEEG